jgi:hypothetical protein
MSRPGRARVDDDPGRAGEAAEQFESSGFPWLESDRQWSHGRILRPGVVPVPRDS